MPRTYRKKVPGEPRRPGPGQGMVLYPRRTTVRRITEIMSLGHTLDRVCQMPGMPTRDCVMKWQRADPQVRRVIAAARAIGADALVEECLAIADDATEGSVKVDRLRINTRLRLAAAWAPEQYARAPAMKNSAPVQVVIDFGAMGVRMTDADALPSLPAPDGAEKGDG